MRAAILAALLLAGCAHDPLDLTEIDAKAVDARNRVNDLATELGELATPIMMFCGIVGDEDAKCTALRATYDAGRSAVITAQRYIDAFAKTGQGLAIVEAGVTVVEAAVQEVVAETDRLLDEVKNVVAGTGGTGNEGSGSGGGETPAAVGAAGPASEGEGSAAATDEGEASGGAPEGHAREVGADAGGEEAK